MIIHRRYFPAFVVAILIGGAVLHALRAPLIFHKIYIGGTVLTMDRVRPVAEAVVTRGNRIVFVGDKDEALSRKRWYTSIIDLQGRALMPGFIDAHSHFLATGLPSVLINLNAAPLGEVETLDQLYQRIEEEVSRRQPGEWVVGFNYDNTRFPSMSHPDRLSLDEVARNNPVYVRHHSGHMGVGNSLALSQLLKFIDNDKTYQPGLTLEEVAVDVNSRHATTGLGVYPQSQRLNGLLQEKAAPPLSRFLNDLSLVDYWRIFRQARDTYTGYGYTTVQEGSAGGSEKVVLSWLSALGILPVRVNVWISADKLGRGDSTQSVMPVRKRFFQADTVKIIADGSPQGATAYLSKPYHNDSDSRGISLHNQRELARLISKYRKGGFRVAIHANGDAAIDDAIDAVKLLRRTQPEVFSGELQVDTGPSIILVHAQTIRSDQLQTLGELGISPSFFSAHSWYWGDWHRQQTLGQERAAFISPTASAADLQLDFTIHSDAPVTSPDPWHLLWITTERLTRSGFRLGSDERISRSEALRAMTINAARQAGQHDSLGSITVGKLADLIIVNDNPLRVNDVRRLHVDETVVNGVSVYRR